MKKTEEFPCGILPLGGTAPNDVLKWQDQAPIRLNVFSFAMDEPGHTPSEFTSEDGDELRDLLEKVAADAAPLLARFGLRLCSESALSIAGVLCLGDWPTFRRDPSTVPPMHVAPVGAAVAQVGQLAHAFRLAALVTQTHSQAPLLVSADADGAALVSMRAQDLLRLFADGCAPLRAGNADALASWKKQQIVDVCIDAGMGNPETPPRCYQIEGRDFVPPPINPGCVRMEVRSVRREDVGRVGYSGRVWDDPEGLVTSGNYLRILVDDKTNLSFFDVVDCCNVNVSRFECSYVRTVLHGVP